MNESRESALAALLARGLSRVQRRAERTGTRELQHHPEPEAVVRPRPDPDASGEQAVAVNRDGDQL